MDIKWNLRSTVINILCIRIQYTLLLCNPMPVPSYLTVQPETRKNILPAQFFVKSKSTFKDILSLLGLNGEAR